MEIKLKSNTYYNFYKLRSVKIIDDKKIILVGSTEKGKRYKTIELFVRMLESESHRRLIDYCRKEMDVLVYIGLCPNCDSDKILVHKQIYVKKEINKPKSKYIEYESHVVCYTCGRCNKMYYEEQLKPCNIVVYYV